MGYRYEATSLKTDAASFDAFATGSYDGETPCLMQASNKFLPVLTSGKSLSRMVEQLRPSPFSRALRTLPSKGQALRTSGSFIYSRKKRMNAGG